MKRLLGLLVAAVLVASVHTVSANCGNCPGDKAAKKGAGCPALKGIELSADQQAKVDALKAECKKTGCSVTATANMDKGMKDILTADQYKQWKEACAKCADKGGCCGAKKTGE